MSPKSARALLLTALCLATLVLSQAPSADQDPSSIVKVTATCDGISRCGTGFAVAIETEVAYVATAKHVIEGCQKISVEWLGGKKGAHVRRLDENIDLALIAVQAPPARARALHISKETPEAGSTASLVGYPQCAPELRFATVTLSNLEGSVLSLTGTAAPGSSGSPVLDKTGTVVAMETREEGGYLYAVPGSMLQMMIQGWLPEDLRPGIRVNPGGTTHDCKNLVLDLDQGFLGTLSPKAEKRTILATMQCKSESADGFGDLDSIDFFNAGIRFAIGRQWIEISPPFAGQMILNGGSVDLLGMDQNKALVLLTRPMTRAHSLLQDAPWGCLQLKLSQQETVSQIVVHGRHCHTVKY